MLQDTPREGIEVHDSVEVYRGAVWGVIREEFSFAGEELVRDYMQHMGAVAVVAVNEKDEILTITQYRHPASLDMVEIPAGLIDSLDEDPLEAAKRELKEETGYEATDWSVLVDVYNSPGSSTETLRIYLARNLTASDWTPAELHGEEREIRRNFVPINVALKSVMQGEWQSPSAVLGVLSFVASRDLPRRVANSSWAGRLNNLKTGRVFQRRT